MPLTVEDGSGIAGADSYGDLDAIKARWDAVGYDYTGQSDTLIEQAARRATEWLEGKYAVRFPGDPSSATQGLHFPATGATDIYGNTLNGVPTAVFYAQCEAAYRELSTPNSLTPDIVLGASESRAVKRRKVGPGGMEREFERVESADELKPTLTAVESLLSKILTRRYATGIMAV